MNAAHAARLFDLAGRTCVVSGAASGLGLAIAETLVANGATVLLLDRDAQPLADAAARLGAASRAVDVTDAAATRHAIEGRRRNGSRRCTVRERGH